MNLHHRAGFLLAQVDGLLSYEDLAAVSGMSRLETFRILAELKNQGVITT
jgi:DNA-binding IclR family transcriptional regulator